jgi:hypothetical protein
MGVAAELVATSPSLAFPATVLLPSVPGPVVAVPVELDDQLVLRPAAIDIATANEPVGLR